jgi:hypothetical protein
MIRKLTPLLFVIPLLAGCAGPSKLAERSEGKLAEGQMWRAWTLATQALDKAPGNPRAVAAAENAAAAIAADWQRRIHALAAVDSIAAAEQVLEFVTFRGGAARYVSVRTEPGWSLEERTLRETAARMHYASAKADILARRPKSAYHHFVDSERFAPGYRDAAALADRTLDQALTRVAIVPLRASDATMAHEVAASWRGDVVEHMTPPGRYFTRVLPIESVEQSMRVADLGRVSRDDAIRLGRKAGADRVVWGSIGKADAKSGISFFSDKICRRIVERTPDGQSVTHWLDVPIDVVSRTRTVTVDLEYELISTRTGATLARHQEPRTMKARVVWTAFTPEGAPDSYSLVSEQTRAGDPERAKQVETKWKAVVGEGTTLSQVLEAKTASAKQSNDGRQAVARLIAGAAFVMMEDLPSTEDLTFAALAGSWEPIFQDLARLDGVDDVDLDDATAAKPLEK